MHARDYISYNSFFIISKLSSVVVNLISDLKFILYKMILNILPGVRFIVKSISSVRK